MYAHFGFPFRPSHISSARIHAPVLEDGSNLPNLSRFEQPGNTPNVLLTAKLHATTLNLWYLIVHPAEWITMAFRKIPQMSYWMVSLPNVLVTYSCSSRIINAHERTLR